MEARDVAAYLLWLKRVLGMPNESLSVILTHNLGRKVSKLDLENIMIKVLDKRNTPHMARGLAAFGLKTERISVVLKIPISSVQKYLRSEENECYKNQYLTELMQDSYKAWQYTYNPDLPDHEDYMKSFMNATNKSHNNTD